MWPSWGRVGWEQLSGWKVASFPRGADSSDLWMVGVSSGSCKIIPWRVESSVGMKTLDTGFPEKVKRNL